LGIGQRPSAIIERTGDCIQKKLKGATGTVDFDPGGRSHMAAVLRAWTWPPRLGWLPEKTLPRKAMAERRLRELGELFQKIEQSAIRQKQIDDAVSKNPAIEGTFRHSEPAQFTAPPAPHA
jgi:hypothetical protein